MASLRRWMLLWSASAASAVACADSSGPVIASLTVVTATTGPAPDADGYTVRIDADRREPLGITDTLHLSGLTAREHRVELEGVASNCAVSGSGTRTVNTTGSGDAQVLFDVLCSGTFGTLQLVTATDGADLDPSGYVARVSDVRELTIAGSAVVSSSLPTGSYEVTLEGVARNCTLDGPSTRTIQVFSGGVSRLEFTLHCAATTPAGAGREIAFVRRPQGFFGELGRLHLMNDDGTSVRILPTISGLEQTAPDWFSDGGRLGFLAEDQNCDFECSKPYVLALGSGTTEPSTHNILFSDISWSPDGSLIVYEDVSCFTDCGDEPVTSFIVVAPLDASSRMEIASDSLEYFTPAWLEDGTALVYVRRSEGFLDIARRNPDGSGEVPISRNLASEFVDLRALAPSPDGSRLAFSGQAVDQGFATQVYVMGLDGSGPMALTGGPFNNFDPAWSPDGRRIAFVSDRDVNEEIYVMDAEGGNALRITNDPAHDTEPAWRP